LSSKEADNLEILISDIFLIEQQLQTFQSKFASLYMICDEKYCLSIKIFKEIMNKVVEFFSIFESSYSEQLPN